MGDNVDQVVVNEDNLHDFVGKEIFTSDRLYDQTPPGVVMGLAYTQLGGATLYIETIGNTDNSKPGAGLLQTTGRMGEVMKESSSIAQAYARHFLKEVDAENDMLEAGKLNMHIPEGATPKDGPSAGVTMTTALLSLALGKPVKPDLAMTGELTITGKVLKVGGIKEKIIAARREKITTVILPRQNEADFRELKEYLTEGITAHFVDHYDDVYCLAFEEGVVPSLPRPTLGQPFVTVSSSE